MIPMSCPSCGKRGNVPLDRLNTRMNCRKCGAIFHLDGGGRTILGDPTQARAAETGSSINEGTDYLGMAFGKLALIPGPIWIGLAAILVAFGGYSAIDAFRRSSALNPAQTYAQRMHEAGRAFLNKDAAALGALAVPGTEAALAQLVNLHRMDVGDGKATDEGVTIVTGPLPAKVEPASADLTFLATPQPGVKKVVPYTLKLYWAVGDNGRLALDGKKTLDDADFRAAERKRVGVRK